MDSRGHYIGFGHPVLGGPILGGSFISSDKNSILNSGLPQPHPKHPTATFTRDTLYHTKHFENTEKVIQSAMPPNMLYQGTLLGGEDARRSQTFTRQPLSVGQGHSAPYFSIITKMVRATMMNSCEFAGDYPWNDPETRVQMTQLQVGEGEKGLVILCYKEFAEGEAPLNHPATCLYNEHLFKNDESHCVDSEEYLRIRGTALLFWFDCAVESQVRELMYGPSVTMDARSLFLQRTDCKDTEGWKRLGENEQQRYRDESLAIRKERLQTYNQWAERHGRPKKKSNPRAARSKTSRKSKEKEQTLEELEREMAKIKKRLAEAKKRDAKKKKSAKSSDDDDDEEEEEDEDEQSQASEDSAESRPPIPAYGKGGKGGKGLAMSQQALSMAKMNEEEGKRRAKKRTRSSTTKETPETLKRACHKKMVDQVQQPPAVDTSFFG